MKHTAVYLLLFSIIIVLSSCHPVLPGKWSSEDFADVVSEGEGSTKFLPDTSLMTERQRRLLGDELSLWLGAALLERGRAAEASRLFGMVLKSGDEEWKDAAAALKSCFFPEPQENASEEYNLPQWADSLSAGGRARMETLLQERITIGGEGVSVAVESLTDFYRRTGRLIEGAAWFAAVAGPGDWELNLAAGRLLRWAALYERAGAVLEDSLAAVPIENRERVLWYLQDCRLKAAPWEAGEVLAEYAPLWGDPSYYADSLDYLIAWSLRGRHWSLLEEIHAAVAGYADPGSAAKLLYITTRLREVGILHSEAVESPYERIITLSPNSYYAWLARKRRGDGGFFTAFGEGAATGVPMESLPSEAGAADPVLSFLTELGYFRLADEWIKKEYDGDPAADRDSFYAVAAAMQVDGRWLDSIRLITRLPRNLPPEERNSRELGLYYPRAYRGEVEAAAAEYDHSPALIFGLIREESGFTPAIESWAGARGLMQLMPSTAEDVAGRMGLDHWELDDPSSNLAIGCWYLDWLQWYVGGLMPSILAYNGGPGRIRALREQLYYLPSDLFAEALPMAETRNYGPKVLVSAIYYGYLYYGISPEQTVAGFFPDL